ncbi:hypothetical protein I203_107812 [Kwoniella mangroviensis CBS 8507]|uniref:hypothetical protein n=1 Tax=Kwoniella mangroviensis CBS 8507 TaxID=1296122 RepID=UPI00080CD32F|nr:uncharacterized protein I203_08547 [Kwoniella mangroviensis CBS 8507]OCF62377.1 hypothetical protein I203_08547 [Kwoniella mangroviensis CBS 8507]
MINLPGFVHSGDTISIIRHKTYHTSTPEYLTATNELGVAKAQFRVADPTKPEGARQWIALTVPATEYERPSHMALQNVSTHQYLYVRDGQKDLFTIPPPPWPPTQACMFDLSFPNHRLGKHFLEISSDVLGPISPDPNITIDRIIQSSTATEGRLRPPPSLTTTDTDKTFMELEVFIRVADEVHADTFQGITVKFTNHPEGVPGVLTENGAKRRELLSCDLALPVGSNAEPLKDARNLTFSLGALPLDPVKIQEIYILEHNSKVILEDFEVKSWVSGTTELVVRGEWRPFDTEGADLGGVTLPVPAWHQCRVEPFPFDADVDKAVDVTGNKEASQDAVGGAVDDSQQDLADHQDTNGFAIHSLKDDPVILPQVAIQPTSADMNAAIQQTLVFNAADALLCAAAGNPGVSTQAWNASTSTAYEMGYRVLNMLSFIKTRAAANPGASRFDVVNAYFPDGSISYIQREMLSYMMQVQNNRPAPQFRVDQRNSYISIGRPTIPMPIELAALAAISGAAARNVPNGPNDTIGNLLDANVVDIEWHVKVQWPHVNSTIPAGMLAADQTDVGKWRPVITNAAASQGIMICFREVFQDGSRNPWRCLAFHVLDPDSRIASPGHGDGFAGLQQDYAAIINYRNANDVLSDQFNVRTMRTNRRAARRQYPMAFLPGDIVIRHHVHGHYGVVRNNNIADGFRYQQLSEAHHFVTDWAVEV